MAIDIWDSPAAATGPQTFEEVGRLTMELLESRGWCLWPCSLLGGDTIVIARDEEAAGYPQGYPVYTAAELEGLEDMDEAAVRLIHEAKKINMKVKV